MTIIFVNGTALVKDSMRYNRRRIYPGDSTFDILNLFGKPLYKRDVGELIAPSGSRNVELWIYQHELRRWELTIASGRVLVIKKIRLRRVR
jgi:hypothetical protein